MSILSDNRGRTEWLNFGDVSFLEAASSVAFFTGTAVGFSNFDVQIPTGGGTVRTLSESIASFNIPVLGTMVLEIGLTIATLLFIVQILDSAVSYGRSNNFEVKNWMDSLPTGLTIGVVSVIVLHFSAIFQFSAIMDIINQNLGYEFLVLAYNTAIYVALSSQD